MKTSNLGIVKQVIARTLGVKQGMSKQKRNLLKQVW